MKLGLIFLISASAFAQATLTLSGPASVTAGQTATLTLTLSGSVGLNLSGILWNVGPASGVTVTSSAPGTAATAATKSVWCGGTGASCIEVGANPATSVITNAPMADGVVATVQMSVATSASGTFSLPLTGLQAADVNGVAVPLVSGPPYTAKVLSRCDFNGDGSVDFTDVAAIINPAIGKGACPAGVTGGCTLQAAIGVLRAALGGSCPF